MLLKRLELNGFKSFAKKTVLEFPEGVTAIVGPNGSGKSNVIDAIRWLLGERDAKHLRGGNTSDLIFGGTDGKSRSGMASATLFFDNSTKFFPLDYDEVEIRREVSRDGVSSYYINKSEVRLKDLVELLSQSRLGTKGIIVISQGNSDLFIKATPQERRDMIEEILGLREFRIKKQDAERKLKNTSFNAEKAKALIEEIEPHLRLLKRQTSKWEKRGEIEADLMESENSFFTSRATGLQENFLSIDPSISELDKKIHISKRELGELQEGLSRIESSEPEDRNKLTGLRKEKGSLQEDRRGVEKDIADINVKLAIVGRDSQGEKGVDVVEVNNLLKDLYEEAQGMLESLDLEKARGLLQKLVREAKRVFSGTKTEKSNDLEEFEGLKKKLAEKLEDVIEKIGKFDREESELEKKLEKFTAVFKEAWQRVEVKKDDISGLEDNKSHKELEKEKWGFKMQELKDQIRQTGRKWEEFVRPGVQSISESESEELERKIYRLRGQLAALGEVDEALVKEAKETEERHVFLSHQLEDLNKAHKDLEEVILELSHKIHDEFNEAMKSISDEFDRFFKLMFKGGHAKLVKQKYEKPKLEEGEEEIVEEVVSKYKDLEAGVEIELSLPKKKISSLDILSGGERSLVSIAALFALVSVSPPPFLVLDEIDAPLDEKNAGRFADMIKDFSEKVQFVVVTHNRGTMEAANVLYGVTIGDDGASKIVSLKME